MEELRYYKIQHLGTLADKPYWYGSNPRYYGIDKANYFTDLNEAKELLAGILGKTEESADKFRIVYHVETEEVVA